MNILSDASSVQAGTLLNNADPSLTTRVSVTFRGGRGTLCIQGDSTVQLEAELEAHDKRSRTLGVRCIPCAESLQVWSHELIGATSESERSFRVWYCTLKKGNGTRQTRRLRKSMLFSCSSAKTAVQTVNLLRSLGTQQADAGSKRLLVIVNPHSGRRKARKTYHAVVEPMLLAAGFDITVHETQRPGHAADIVRGEAVESMCAVVAVGGDGTAFEVLQGYFQSPKWEQRIKTPFCLVPSGSGNALAANCGLWTAVTAAHAICKGKRRPIDIFSVLQPPGRRYYAFLSIYYGMMANLDRGTDHLRWMGPVRFTIGAVQQVLQKKKYAAQVAFLPQTAAAQVPQQQPSEHGKLPGSRGVAVAQSGRSVSQITPSGPPTPLIDALGHVDEIDLRNAESLGQGWKIIPSEHTSFFAAVNLPLLDFNSCTGPEADFDTGCLDVMYVERLGSRIEGLEFLDTVGKGKHVALGKVRLEKVVALIIEPSSPGTWLVADGEDIPYQRVYIEVHPSLCSVIVA